MAGLGDHDLRTGRLDSAGLDVADAARLSQHVFEAGHRRHAGGCGRADQSDAADARYYQIHRWQRPCLRRSSFSLSSASPSPAARSPVFTR